MADCTLSASVGRTQPAVRGRARASRERRRLPPAWKARAPRLAVAVAVAGSLPHAKMSFLPFLLPAGGPFSSSCALRADLGEAHTVRTFFFMFLRGLCTPDCAAKCRQSVAAAAVCGSPILAVRRGALQSQLPVKGQFLVTWLQSASLATSPVPTGR